MEFLHRLRWLNQHLGWKEYLFFAFWLVFFLIFWTQAIFIDKHGNLQAGHANLWGDWAVHFTMGSAMAYRDLILDSSPLLLDAPFTYPFATNLVPALLVRMGVPFFSAFVLCSFFFSLLLVTALYCFYRTVLRQRNLALLAACLFLFNGGIGFYYFFQDVVSSAEPFTTLMNPPHEYTNYEPKHIKWISVISSMILPQRAFTMGFGLALAALALIFYAFNLLQDQAGNPRRYLLLIASVILGFLPIIHAHSFLACFVILACWFFADLVRTERTLMWPRFLAWMSVLTLTSAIALPIIFTFVLGNANQQFISWFPGWYAKEFDINWFSFWFENWTFVPFLAFLAIPLLVFSKVSNSLRWHVFLVLLPGLLLFVVPNLVLTQPWIWDNTKLFIWASVFFSALAAYALRKIFGSTGWFAKGAAYLMRRYSREQAVFPEKPDGHARRMLSQVQKHLAELVHTQKELAAMKDSLKGIGREIEDFLDPKSDDNIGKFRGVRHTVLSAVLLVILGSGVLDAYYTLRIDLHNFTMYNRQELALAQWAKNETESDSVWLVSTKHNHWLFNLTGRQALITYAGWLWTHGYDYHSAERDAKTIYRSANRGLIDKHQIDYVVIDNHARREMSANDRLFRDRFRLVKQLGEYTIYSVNGS